jgi:tetratricopeptide (TPR) repeat protein
MTMVTNASPRAGAKPNRQQRRQAARVAKKGRRGNGAAAPSNAALQEAVKLHKAGHPHEALQLYRKILADRPDQVDALNLGGVANLELNHIGEAVKLLQAAVRLQPSYAEAHNNLGNALQAAGKLDEAAAAYRRAVGIKPGYAEAHYNLGILLQKSSDSSDAMAAYRRAVEINPNFAEAHASLGAMLQEFGELDDAIAACRRAIEIKPDYTAAYNNLGTALLASGKSDEGVRALNRALEIEPGYAEAHYNLGHVLYRETDLEASADAFAKAVHGDPDLAMARFYLGMIRDQQGDTEAAADHFARIARSPNGSSHLVDSWNYAKGRRGAKTRFHANPFETLGFTLDHARGDGLVLEFGVRFGTSINFIAQHGNQEVHGFDSFEGLPESWEGFRAGVYTTDGRLPQVESNVSLHAGWFADTLPAFVAGHPGPVRFMNVDCDLCSSTRTIFEFLADRIVPGTVIVFDEYFMNPHWREDEYKAFQEAVERHSWKYEYIAFNLFSKQVAIIIA